MQFKGILYEADKLYEDSHKKRKEFFDKCRKNRENINKK
jgi:hypothetical protein